MEVMNLHLEKIDLRRGGRLSVLIGVKEDRVMTYRLSSDSKFPRLLLDNLVIPGFPRR